MELQVADLDEDVDFLFNEQIIQDERLLNVEEATDAINAELDTVDDEIEGMLEQESDPVGSVAST